MATEMIIQIEPNLKNKISQLAKSEGKNLNELVQELFVKYTKERDISTYIDDLWTRIGQDFAQNNITEMDIDKAIKEVRAKNA